MKKAPKNSNPTPPPADPLEEHVFRGLLAEGNVIPETPEELAVAEAGAASSPPLPEKLRDSDAVLRRIKERIEGKDAKTVPFPLPQETAVEDELEELERVARHGGAIGSATKEKMAKNRRIADEQAAQE